jgi:hypothetical protein
MISISAPDLGSTPSTSLVRGLLDEKPRGQSGRAAPEAGDLASFVSVVLDLGSL